MKMVRLRRERRNEKDGVQNILLSRVRSEADRLPLFSFEMDSLGNLDARLIQLAELVERKKKEAVRNITYGQGKQKMAYDLKYKAV